MTLNDNTIETVFAPLIGQMAWQVRADDHACVMMEFGAPHLEIREPRVAKAKSTPKVERLRARRIVRVIGDWHLWIESCNWTLTTRNGTTSSEGKTDDLWQEWMEDVAGQHLVSVDSAAPGAINMRFDMGAVLEAKPDPDGDLDSWSLYPWQGPVTACDATGRITVEPEKA